MYPFRLPVCVAEHPTAPPCRRASRSERRCGRGAFPAFFSLSAGKLGLAAISLGPYNSAPRPRTSTPFTGRIKDSLPHTPCDFRGDPPSGSRVTDLGTQFCFRWVLGDNPLRPSDLAPKSNFATFGIAALPPPGEWWHPPESYMGASGTLPATTSKWNREDISLWRGVIQGQRRQSQFPIEVNGEI